MRITFAALSIMLTAEAVSLNGHTESEGFFDWLTTPSMMCKDPSKAVAAVAGGLPAGLTAALPAGVQAVTAGGMPALPAGLTSALPHGAVNAVTNAGGVHQIVQAAAAPAKTA